MQEIRAQISYSDQNQRKIYFYRSAKGKIIDLIVCKNEKVDLCIKLIPEEQSQSKQYDLLRFFKEKNKPYTSENTKLIALTGSLVKMKDKDVLIYPWESIV